MILALLLMVAMPMMAERVSPETARKVATTFLNNNGAKSAQLTDLSKEAGFTNLYIFNAEQGFVVMAADDCVKPILGYSLTGRFVAENMPTNVSGWLHTAETAKLWKELTEGNSKVAKAAVVVAPLIQTKWSQNKYYNALCPEATGGPEGHAYTGCVATAMAQIMKYWGYPAHGIGSHSYTWNGQTLSADFGNTTYDWSNMANYYQVYYVNGTDQYGVSVSNTQEEITAVATLMYHCGVAVNMDYGAGGSAASSSDAANALKTYFNYSSNIEYKQKSSYEDADWIQMVKDELNAQRPLEYSGRSGTGNNTSGHSFVCDGYDNANYFHFNWGWWGQYDGYFSLSNLDTGANSSQPGAGNGVYTYVQFAIFGIQPASTIAAPSNLTYTVSGLQDITLTWDAVSAASSYNVYRNGNLVDNVSENTYSETAPFGTFTYYVRSVDANGQLSLGSNTVSVTIAYLTPIVDDLTATLSGNSVNLSWTAPEWCYPETPSAMLTYGDGGMSSRSSAAFWAHRFLANDLTQHVGKAIYKISIYAYDAGIYTCYVYKGASSQYYSGDNIFIPTTLMAEKTVEITSTGKWVDIDLNELVPIDEQQDLWVVLNYPNGGSGLYPATYSSYSSSDNHGNYYGRWNYGYAGGRRGFVQNGDIAYLIRTYLTDGTYTYNLYQDGTRIGQNLSGTTANATLNNNAANLFTVKTNYYDGETEASNKIGFAKGNTSLSSLSLAANDKMTITEGSKLTVSGTLSDVNADNLILENGAQLVNSSDGVLATVKKTVSAFTQNGGWNLIASPIADDILPSSDNGLLTNSYDLYTFDQSQDLEWRNHEAEAFSIENKTGYLYANSGDLTTISFAGALANAAAPTTLVYDGNATWEGFNLIGNPYPCNAYIDRSFYVLNTDGSDFTLGSNPIPPCAAILVQAQGTGESVTFSKTASKNNPSIVATVKTTQAKDETAIDKARVSFMENDNLTKFTMGQGTARLYIPQGNRNYAVACANGQNEMPLNFKAAKNGTYTLDFKVENMEADYLHLIDNMTGADVDLLATPSYTFESSTDDYEARFRLALSPISEGADGDNETFAYINDGNIIITGVEDACNASLQVVDMMGRVVLAGDAMNRVSTNGMTAGVYVLRLINGEQVKTQKIVVR